MKKCIKLFSLCLCLILTLGVLTACGENAGDKGLKIGILQYASHPSLDNCREGVLKGLEEKGYKNGENVTIDYQNANNQSADSDQIAKNMVAKGYNMIIAIATPAAVSAYSAAAGTNTNVIFCAVSDPVEAKLVSSLDAPGGNCTGTSDLLNLEAQLKMIRAFLPESKKIGILYTTSEANSASHLAQLKELAPGYGFEIVEQGVQSAADIPTAAASLAGKVDCINNFTDNNVVENLNVVLQQANQANIPVFGSEIEQVKNGCLASESLDYVVLGQKTGYMAARVLGGEKAETMAVERIKDSFPCYNPDVLSSLSLTLPAGYAAAEQVKGE